MDNLDAYMPIPVQEIVEMSRIELEMRLDAAISSLEESKQLENVLLVGYAEMNVRRLSLVLQAKGYVH